VEIPTDRVPPRSDAPAFEILDYESKWKLRVQNALKPMVISILLKQKGRVLSSVRTRAGEHVAQIDQNQAAQNPQ
jgi:hypothetical protein